MFVLWCLTSEYHIAWMKQFLKSYSHKLFGTLTTGDEKAEFANSIDLDEVAHNKPPHLVLHCLPSSLGIL